VLYVIVIPWPGGIWLIYICSSPRAPGPRAWAYILGKSRLAMVRISNIYHLRRCAHQNLHWFIWFYIKDLLSFDCGI